MSLEAGVNPSLESTTLVSTCSFAIAFSIFSPKASPLSAATCSTSISPVTGTCSSKLSVVMSPSNEVTLSSTGTSSISENFFPFVYVVAKLTGLIFIGLCL